MGCRLWGRTESDTTEATQQQQQQQQQQQCLSGACVPGPLLQTFQSHWSGWWWGEEDDRQVNEYRREHLTVVGAKMSKAGKVCLPVEP